MKLFIDTTQIEFIACVFDENEVKYKSLIETKYKVEEIIHFFDQCPFVSKIEKIYINIGPGSFTGSRIALLYVRTLAQINNSIKIYIANIFDILSIQMKKTLFKKNIYINATKNKSYVFSKNKISIVPKSNKEQKIDYGHLITNFNQYENIFKQEELINIKPLYASEPQIGEIKK